MEALKRTRSAAIVNATRRAARRKDASLSDQRFNIKQQAKDQHATKKLYITNERKNRREDWEVGPRLAPRRDVGTEAERYATIGQSILHSVEKTDRDSAKVRTWLAEGDRVVVLEGKDKGKIARVESVDKRGQAVRLKATNQVDFFVPEYMRTEDQDPRPIVPYSAPIPWTHVKLVHAVPDRSGSFVDVIVNRVRLVRPDWKTAKKGNIRDWKRIIPGLETEIPWPVVEEAEKDDHDSDTLRITVDAETHRPYLLRPPMPKSVINELRNEYSKFRSRPDPEKVAKREAWALQAAKKKQLSRGMAIPMMELQEKNRTERAKRELSEEQLAKIGEFMTRQDTHSAGDLSQKEA